MEEICCADNLEHIKHRNSNNKDDNFNSYKSFGGWVEDRKIRWKEGRCVTLDDGQQAISY